MTERKPAAARKVPPLKAVQGGAAGPTRPRRAAKKAAEPAKPDAPATVHAAAEAGDDRETLVRMRSRVARTIDDPATPPRDLASLTRRMQEMLKDIKAFDARSEGVAGAGGQPAADESFDASAI